MLDPPEVVHTLRETLYNVNVSLMLPQADLQLYVMLHYRSKSHKGTISRSLIFSRERLFLCTEDYSKWPSSTGGVGAQFESIPDIEKFAKKEHSKQLWRSLGGMQKPTQFETQFTRDVSDVQKIETGGACDLTIFFEDEQEMANAKENKNKPREWELVTYHPQEQKKIVKILSTLWKDLFRINLPIEAR